MKKYLLTVGKFALAGAIVAWLLWSVDPEQYAQLRDRPKNWSMLFASFALCLAAVFATFIRWWLLVRSLDLPFRLRDAFRLGFLSYMLNFVSVGTVGGDLFKAIFIAREQPGRRTEAVATVIVDRGMGLYALLVATSGAIFLGALTTSSATVTAVCNLTLWVTGLGTVAVMIVLAPGVTGERSIKRIRRLPLIGKTAARVMIAFGAYRSRPFVLVLTGSISLVVHMMLAVAIFLVADGIFPEPPTLAEHFVIVPLANVAGALPFTPAGLGTFEAAMERLYQVAAAKAGDGVIVALAYRIITILIAGVGGLVYISSRRELQAVMRDAERAAEPTTPQAECAQ